MKGEHPDAVPKLAEEPVLAVCGWSGSGKTTVLEALIPRLVERGLRVAVVKHDAHGLQIDRRGKDSDRLFLAGASVHLRGSGEGVWRIRESGGHDLVGAVVDLLRHHDLVLVEGHKGTPLPKVWCSPEDSEPPPPEVGGIRVILPWGNDRVQILEQQVERRLNESFATRAVVGGVMVGGSSRRMGRPKHELMVKGQSMLRRSVEVLGRLVGRTVVLGGGRVPDDVTADGWLVDAPDCGEGPLAAVLTAFRWAPRCCWVFAACDMPLISEESLNWLLERRRPGRWAVIPRQRSGHLEPLLALYEPQAAWLFAEQLRLGRRALHHVDGHPAVDTPRIPEDIVRAWTNVNTSEELAALDL